MKPLLIILIIILSTNIISQDKYTTSNSLNKTTTNDDYNYIAINQFKMWVSNNGRGSHYPITNTAGLLWPGGDKANLPIVFTDGLICGGKINGDTVVTGNFYNAGLQAGKILDSGLPDNPELEKYRVYKISKDWQKLLKGESRNEYEKDFIEWPANDGAPWFDLDGNGIYDPYVDQPKFEGDEVLWFVSNDLDRNRVISAFNNLPMGLEIQFLTYGFAKHNELGNTLYKKYKIINKSQNTIDSMYISLFSDPDVGYALDDYVGCDTLLNLAYAYNGDRNDEGYYGSNPPAVGYKLVQGLKVKSVDVDSAKYSGKWIKGYKNLPMNSFAFFFGSGLGSFTCRMIIDRIPVYNIIRGKECSGENYIDPYTGDTTRFPFSGDPVIDTGWTMPNHPSWQQWSLHGDVRMFLNSGPITMAPGDTQEVVIAVVAARGSDHIQSITELRNAARTAQIFYDLYSPDLADIDFHPLIPDYYYLGQNYPNPFNPKTQIDYELPLNGLVTLKVYDVIGREIATLVNEEKTAGKHQVDFSANNLSSGIYFYTLTSRAYSKTKKMVVIK